MHGCRALVSVQGSNTPDGSLHNDSAIAVRSAVRSQLSHIASLSTI